MKPFIQDGHSLVLRAVRKLIAVPGAIDASERDAPPRMVIEAIETRDWASATFVGQQHTLSLRLEGDCASVGEAVERLSAGLAEVDVSGAGYFLADAALETFTSTLEGDGMVAELRIEALTIEE